MRHQTLCNLRRLDEGTQALGDAHWLVDATQGHERTTPQRLSVGHRHKQEGEVGQPYMNTLFERRYNKQDRVYF